MKKSILILGAVAALSLASCKKDWTCKCVDQSNNASYHTIPNATLKDAKNTCEGMQYQVGSIYSNCSID